MKKLFLLLTFITLTSTSSFASSNYVVDKALEECTLGVISEFSDASVHCYGNYTQTYSRADGSTGTRTMTLYLGVTSSESTCIIKAYAQLATLNQ